MLKNAFLILGKPSIDDLTSRFKLQLSLNIGAHVYNLDFIVIIFSQDPESVFCIRTYGYLAVSYFIQSLHGMHEIKEQFETYIILLKRLLILSVD